MLGIEPGAHVEDEEGMHAISAHGVKAVSLGFVVPTGTSVDWRGPWIDKAVRELIFEIEWGQLDYLIVDLPPGTSDASLSLAEEVPVAGVVMVSQPQRVALEDVRKAVEFFTRRGVPILGMVENMSGDIFGRGGARKAAAELAIEFLGELPLGQVVRESGDTGVPVVVNAPESPEAQAFVELAEQVAARCSVLQYETEWKAA